MATPPPLRLLLGISLAALLGLASPAQAQEQPQAQAPKPEASPEPPAIQAIPIDQIPDEAERAIASVEALRPGEDTQGERERLRSALDAARSEIDTHLPRIQEALDEAPGVRVLEDLEIQLLVLREPISQLDEEIQRPLDELGAALEQVEAKAATWKATLEEARAAGASSTTLARIASTRTAIAAARRSIATQHDAFVALRDLLVDPRTALDRLDKRLDTAQQELEEFFRRSRAPIWGADLPASIGRELREGWTDSLRERGDQLGAYLISRSGLLAFELLLFVVLALVLPAIGRQMRSRVVDDYDLRQAGDVFGLPVAMAAVMSVALALQLHTDAPRLFSLLLGIVGIFPTVLIVLRLAPAAVAPLIWGLLTLYLVDQVRALFESVPSLERVIFLAQLLGAFLFLLWLGRPARLGSLPAELLRDPFFRIAGTVMRVAIALFGTAIVADVFGLSILAQLLGDGTLRSTHNALFFYALVMVLESLVAYALVLRPLRLLNLVSRHRPLVRARLNRVLELLAFVAWLWLSLGYFGLDEAARSTGTRVLGAKLGVGALSISLGNVLAMLLVIWITFLIARFVNAVLNDDVFPRVRLGAGVPYAVSSLVRYGLIILGIFLALAASGIQLSNLTFIVGGLGVGIGFGLQNVVNNFVSGLILLFERPFRVGDTVQLPDLWGEIRRIGIRASVIRTFDGAEVIVPNGSLISDTVTNWTRSDRHRRVELNVGVDYGTPAQRVIDLLLAVASANPRVLTYPEPTALFSGFGDSSLDFMLRVWIADFDHGFSVRSELAVAVQQALADAEIGIPFPQRDLHLRSIAPDAAASLAPSGPPAPPGVPGGLGGKG